MGKGREIIKMGQCILVTGDINELELERRPLSESGDGPNKVCMGVGTWDLFMELLHLFQGVLVVTANEHPS